MKFRLSVNRRIARYAQVRSSSSLRSFKPKSRRFRVINYLRRLRPSFRRPVRRSPLFVPPGGGVKRRRSVCSVRRAARRAVAIRAGRQSGFVGRVKSRRYTC